MKVWLEQAVSRVLFLETITRFRWRSFL